MNEAPHSLKEVQFIQIGKVLVQGAYTDTVESAVRKLCSVNSSDIPVQLHHRAAPCKT